VSKANRWEDAMDYQYIIVNQCLQLLKQSNLPTIKKLRVEIQLIQMKRLLLEDDDLPGKVMYGSYGDSPFDGLLSQMGKICGGNYEGETLTDLMERMSGMLTVLGGQSNSHHAVM
jgi:hypothetical protein